MNTARLIVGTTAAHIGEVMSESPRKSLKVRKSGSERQGELHEKQLVNPMKSDDRYKNTNKKKQPKHKRERRAVSVPETCPEKSPATVSEERKLEKVSAISTDGPIVRGIFKIEKKSCDVVLTATRLIWTQIQPETPTGKSDSRRREEHLELSEVFAVKVKRRRSIGQKTGGTLLGLTLFHCVWKGPKLKHETLHLNNLSVDHCEVWFKHLKEIINGYRDRPKSLKVFLNPASHRKEAYQLYKDEVAPLFKLAEIKTDVTVTQRKGHTLSILKECKLDEYDGVVVIGGDGSVHEAVHGLLLRAQMDAGRDTDSIFTPVRAALPLGVIPAGSTDIVACSVHGIRHAITAAMHIIMGHHQAVDVCSFSSRGQLLHFGFSGMYGFGGRTLLLAERHRWMPPSQRWEFAMIKSLANLKPEDCEVSFLPQKQAQGTTPEPKCAEERDIDVGASVEDEEEWRTVRGLFLNVSVMAIPCICSLAPRGLAPTTRLDNGSMALIAVGNTSKSEFIKHLKRYSSANAQFSSTFVETHSVQAVKLRPRFQGSAAEQSEERRKFDSKNKPWNIDGDLQELPTELLIRVHPQLITLFGVNMEETEEPPIKCSCI